MGYEHSNANSNILIISKCALLTSPNMDVNKLKVFLQEYVEVSILQMHEKYSKIAKNDEEEAREMGCDQPYQHNS